MGGAVVTLSYGHLLWANAILSWIPVLLVLRVTEPPALLDRKKKWSGNLKEVLSTTLVRDATTRFVFLNMVVWGTGGLVMVWANQKYWQESGVPLAWFGVLWASCNLIAGFAGRSAALASARYGRRPLLTVVGALPIVAFFGMASFLGWGGIVLGVLFKVGQGLGGVLFPGSAQREDLLHVPRDRDLHDAAGSPRLLLCPGPPRGIRDRCLGISVRAIDARTSVLDHLRVPDPASGRS